MIPIVRNITSIIFLTLILSVDVRSQNNLQDDFIDNYTSNFYLALPSPQAYKLIEMENTNVNLSNGLPSISIPLFSAKVDGVGLNFLASYNSAGGIKVGEKPTELGLSWGMVGAPTITRVVKGQADEHEDYGLLGLNPHLSNQFYASNLDFINWYRKYGNFQTKFSGTTYTLNFNQSSFYYGQKGYDIVNQMQEQKIDSQPDLFILNINGLSVEFMLFQQSETDSKILINTIFYLKKPNEVNIIYNEEQNTFEVTDLENNIFYFDVKEYSEQSIDNIKGFDVMYNYVSSWKASRIVSGITNDEILLEYNSPSIENVYESIQVSKFYPSNPLGVDSKLTKLKTTSHMQKSFVKNLVKITDKNNKYLFTYSDASDYNVLNLKKLKHITIVNNSVNEIELGHIKFIYDYFVVGGANANYGDKRIRLKELHFTGRDSSEISSSFKFEYDHNYISHDFNSADRWGYKTNSTQALPIINTSSSSPGYTVQYVPSDTTSVKHGLLKQIIYPTGGAKRFYYEVNKAFDPVSQTDVYSGGVRIKSIVDESVVGKNRNRTFIYKKLKNGSLVSSGYFKWQQSFLKHGSIYLGSECITPFVWGDAPEPVLGINVYKSPLIVGAGNPTAYTQISVIESDGSTITTNYPMVLDSLMGPLDITSEMSQQNPYFSREYIRTQPISISNYNNLGDLVSKSTFEYKYLEDGVSKSNNLVYKFYKVVYSECSPDVDNTMITQVKSFGFSPTEVKSLGQYKLIKRSDFVGSANILQKENIVDYSSGGLEAFSETRVYKDTSTSTIEVLNKNSTSYLQQSGNELNFPISKKIYKGNKLSLALNVDYSTANKIKKSYVLLTDSLNTKMKEWYFSYSNDELKELEFVQNNLNSKNANYYYTSQNSKLVGIINQHHTYTSPTVDKKLIASLNNGFIHSISYDSLGLFFTLYQGTSSHYLTTSYSKLVRNQSRRKFEKFGKKTAWELDLVRMSLSSNFINNVTYSPSDIVVVEYDIVFNTLTSDWNHTFAVGTNAWNYASANNDMFVWATVYGSGLRVLNTTRNIWHTSSNNIFTAGKTHSMRYILDKPSNKISVYVDGKRIFSDIPAYNVGGALDKIILGDYVRATTNYTYYIDNFRVYKYGSQVQSGELAKHDGRVTSIKSVDGLTTRFGYDAQGRLVDSRTESGPVTKQFYSYGNLVQDPLAAPYVESVVLSERSPVSVFSSSGWNGVSHTNFGYYLDQEEEYVIKHNSSGVTPTITSFSLSQGQQFWVDVNLSNMEPILQNSSPQVPDPEQINPDLDIENKIVEIAIEHNSGSGSKFVKLRYTEIENKFELLDNTGTSIWTEEISSLSNSTLNQRGWFTISFENTINGKFEVTIRRRGGEVIGKRLSTGSYSGLPVKLTFSLISPSSSQKSVYLARPVLAKRVMSTISYTDGLGRPVQSHTIAGDKRMVSASYLDSKSKPVASLRPFELTNQAGLIAFADLYGSANWNPGDKLESSLVKQVMVNQGYAADQADYAYSLTQYEASPLNRVLTQRGQGKDEHTTTAHVSYSYGVKHSVMAHSTYLGTLTYTISTDQIGNKVVSYADGFGREVLKVVDMNQNALDFDSLDLITLFEYDGLGNLIKSIDPKGFATLYRYNSLGQLVFKQLPDMTDSVLYRYDTMGNVRFVQQPNHRVISPDANQTYDLYDSNPSKLINLNGTQGRLSVSLRNMSSDVIQTFLKEQGQTTHTISASSPDIVNEMRQIAANTLVEIGSPSVNLTTITYTPFKYSYTKYDSFGRITESGEYFGSTSFESANVNDSSFPSTQTQPLVRYYYDELSAVSGASVPNGALARVEYTLSHDLYKKGITSYSYTSQGLIEWVKQEIPRGQSATITSTMYYTYRDDGQLLKKRVQNGSQNLYQWFYYDGFNRLVSSKSNTSDNETGAVADVSYTYDALGQMKTKVLRSGVQQIDYSYNVKGWLTSINNPDGLGSDKFGQRMSYLNNGNISGISFRQSAIADSSNPQLTFGYSYDKAGRLTSSLQTNNNSAYQTSYQYDMNGNMDIISRHDALGASTTLDLAYQPGTNKLVSIKHMDGTDGMYSVSHDSRGNMIGNSKKGITSVSYDQRNLAYRLVTTGGVHSYEHDGSGNRVMKQYNTASALYYIRDADGKVQAVLDKNGALLFWNLYVGSELIGKRNP